MGIESAADKLEKERSLSVSSKWRAKDGHETSGQIGCARQHNGSVHPHQRGGSPSSNHAKGNHPTSGIWRYGQRARQKEAMKLVLVEWLDSHSGQGWQRLDAIRESTHSVHCRSVGWLVSESGGYKTIVPHISGEGWCCALCMR